MEIATGAAGNVIGGLFSKIMENIKNLIHLAEDVDEMKTELVHMKNLLAEIKARIGTDQQSHLPRPLELWVSEVQEFLRTACWILEEYGRLKQSLLHGWFHCFQRRTLYKRVRDWKLDTQRVFQKGYMDFSLINSIDGILATGPRHLVHPGTRSLVGEQVKYAQSKLRYYLCRAYEKRVIVVYGMAGVGKTALLKNLNNSEEVQKAFEMVIWITVSQNRSVKDLQSSIAERIGLKLDTRSSEDEGSLRLNTCLMTRKFLLILDDVWTAIQPERLGVSLTTGRSKIVLSTRSEELIRTMNADQSLKMEPLSAEEGWELFRKRAFGDEPVLPEIEEIARKVATFAVKADGCNSVGRCIAEADQSG